MMLVATSQSTDDADDSTFAADGPIFNAGPGLR